MEMLQSNTNVSESIDSSERLIKQHLDEIMFLREGAAFSNTECHSYRKSVNDSFLSSYEKKALDKSGEIHTDENDNVSLHEESSLQNQVFAS